MRMMDAVRGERGVALVMALLVLLVLSLLSAVLMTSVNVETKIAGHELRGSQALNTAESGVSEAIARLRTGEIPNNLNPLMVAQIFNANPGSVPALGTDSLGLATGQPAGQWLEYSTATRDPNVLTVQYKTDSARTAIYRYDDALNPSVQTGSGLPIFVINSTGREGRDVRRIETEVVQKPFLINIKSALAADHDIEFVGNAVVCGYNHSANIPPPAGENGRAGANSCIGYETAGHLPGSWTTKDTFNGGGATQTGVPVPNQSNQAGFYDGPWDVVGMTQAEFFTWVGAPLSTEPDPPNGIIYLDNNTTTQDASGNFKYSGTTGEGLLYVDGDLTLNSQLVYRGLIYVEGDLKLNGQAWILGSLIVKGKSKIKMNGGATILYSSEAIQLALTKFGGTFVPLSWKEL